MIYAELYYLWLVNIMQNYKEIQYLLTELGHPITDIYVRPGPGFNWHPIAYMLSTHSCVYPPFKVLRFSLESFFRFFIIINNCL
ncbi:hypothetical protein SAMN05421846_10875 [Chryseobacterium taeanense]|uniref:Uncharacterized protein n=1 Tax=Chryseobacterium taeanense TaxID=311334 RepID=A0A1G8KVB0_9FLAO|nr:hypothetical protein SAMN05421846_10875 [Chryseobacterium taeanense]